MDQLNINMEELYEIALDTKNGDSNPLEVSWLETTNEYVINRESIIIIDGLREQEAYQILDKLQGVCNE